MRAPYELVKYVAENGRLPVVNFAAGGVATPADAALMMQLGNVLHQLYKEEKSIYSPLITSFLLFYMLNCALSM